MKKELENMNLTFSSIKQKVQKIFIKSNLLN